MSINSKWWCSNTFHTSKMDVGSSQWWSKASTMSSCHHFIVATVTPNYQNLGQLCQCNCVRVHSYAYPQHMMVLKHRLYIQYGCGKQTVVVYSLDNVIMQSFHSSHAGQNYQNLGQLCQWSSVRVHPYPIHSIWWCSKTFHTSNMDVWSSQMRFMTSFHSSHAGPNYQNLGELS